MDQAPAARTDDLVITRSADDLLIYDLTAHQIHHLDKIAATVFDACDGNCSLEEISTATHLDPGIIDRALHKLSDANLLEVSLPGSPAPARSSRRALLRRTGIAGATVVSISAPAAVAAQSDTCLPLRTECTPGDSNLCCSPGLCDTWASTNLTLCCLPNGVETTSTANCCSGTSSLEEIGSNIRICVPSNG